MNGRLADWTEAILGFDMIQVELTSVMLNNATALWVSKAACRIEVTRATTG
jgi:hypothetical protein